MEQPRVERRLAAVLAADVAGYSASAERVEAACARALVLGTRSYSSVAAILKNRRENAPPPGPKCPS
jgi:hypothetical protein